MRFVFFKQKTAYEMRISDWSSDVCSSDLNSPSASPAVLTRSQAEAEATAAHRSRYLAKLTPKIVWFVLAILAICINLCRSEERRVGKECIRTCPFWWSSDAYTKHIL